MLLSTITCYWIVYIYHINIIIQSFLYRILDWAFSDSLQHEYTLLYACSRYETIGKCVLPPSFVHCLPPADHIPGMKEYEMVEQVCPLYDQKSMKPLKKFALCLTTDNTLHCLLSSYCGPKCENVDKVWILLSCRSYIWPAIEGLFPHDDLAHVLQFIQMTFCMCSAIYSCHVSCGLASFPDFPLTVYCHCNLHADPALPSLSIHIFPVNL